MVAHIIHIILRSAIGQVKIVGLRRILGRERIDLLDNRQDAMLLTELADKHRALLEIIKPDRTGDLEVGEALDLRPAHQGRIQFPAADPFQVVGMQFLGGLHDIIKFLEEPAVDLGQLMDLVHAITCPEGLRDHEDTTVCRLVKRLVDIGDHQLLVLDEAVHALTDHTQALLQRLLESAADSHHLADRFHARAQLAGHAVELAQVPTRDLTNHIVQGRLKEGAGRLRHRVLQVEQAIAQAQLGGHESQRIAGRLRSQRRRAAQAGVHLDHPIILRFRIVRVLHITLAHDADVADDADGQLTQLVIVRIAQGL